MKEDSYKTQDIIDLFTTNTHSKYLSRWYTFKEKIQYRKYVIAGNTKGLKSLCRCVNGSKICPACKIIMYQKDPSNIEKNFEKAIQKKSKKDISN